MEAVAHIRAQAERLEEGAGCTPPPLSGCSSRAEQVTAILLSLAHSEWGFRTAGVQILK